MKKSYNDLQNEILSKTFVRSLIFIVVFELLFDRGNLFSWIFLAKFIFVYIAFLVIYRWGEWGSDKEWIEYLKEKEEIKKHMANPPTE